MKNFLFRIFQNSGLIVVSLGLLYGGILIVKTAILFWNLFYGLPAILLGILLTLISFNEIAKNRQTKASDYHEIQCKVCGKNTLVPMLIETTVCPDCQYRMARRLQLTLLILVAFVAVPVTFHLVKESQDIRNQAHSQPSPYCEIGKWQPSSCQCGNWNQNVNCGSNAQSRLCGLRNYCCTEVNSQWNCVISK